ncbi:MAG TPA: Fe-S cluster protein, partial [Desulfobacterales bacterium]|nr:Fe-S cluster protein [Desulfobacterales bacterium]
MLLKSYSKRVFRAECNPQFESLHCIASLDQDVSEALPYLNAALGGFEYFKEPPAVVFRSRGRLISVHGRQ